MKRLTLPFSVSYYNADFLPLSVFVRFSFTVRLIIWAPSLYHFYCFNHTLLPQERIVSVFQFNWTLDILFLSFNCFVSSLHNNHPCKRHPSNLPETDGVKHWLDPSITPTLMPLRLTSNVSRIHLDFWTSPWQTTTTRSAKLVFTIFPSASKNHAKMYLESQPDMGREYPKVLTLLDCDHLPSHPWAVFLQGTCLILRPRILFLRWLVR